MTSPVDPIMIQLGPLVLRWYGLLIMTGVLAVTWIASRYSAYRVQDPEIAWDLLTWILIPGLIGARLYYVFIQSPRGSEGFGRYMSDPLEIFRIWHGGLHIFGGFLFGVGALMLVTHWRKLPLIIYLDAFALGLPLGQAIGRWGNFINQELYGLPTKLPWGLRIDTEHRISPYDDLNTYPASGAEEVLFHPLFLYESLWNILGFILVLWIVRRYHERLEDGDIFLMYLVWYPFGRFWIEFLRTDSWFFFEHIRLNVVHILTLGAFSTAATILYRRHKHDIDAYLAKRAEEKRAKSSGGTNNNT